MRDLTKPLAASVVRVILADLRERAAVLETSALGPRTTRARARALRQELNKLHEYACAHGVIKKSCSGRRISLTR
jgi:hypothetical protein